MGRVAAETGSGDISLSVVVTSRVTVKKGAGKIDVGGITGALIASTDRGELHVKGGLFSDWQLHSRFGNILIELPPNWKFEVDTATRSGLVSIERADMQKPDAETTAYREKVNGGGKYVRAGARALWRAARAETLLYDDLPGCGSRITVCKFHTTFYKS
jgi:hypothetical protein